MHKLNIYTTKNCPFSKQLKDFLYAYGIPFDEIKADLNKENAQKLQERDPKLRTPVIEISDSSKPEILVGWNEENKKVLTSFFNQVV